MTYKDMNNNRYNRYNATRRVMDKVANGERLTPYESQILATYQNDNYNRHDGYIGRRFKDC